ncbi:uncharacterized protein [Nicotiana tomentosiformis]|uniref:uncharacterized protein n=1 Tax=Nicotiana tomentosiformis TaxID=4098 RepID=UPI00388CBADD
MDLVHACVPQKNNVFTLIRSVEDVVDGNIHDTWNRKDDNVLKAVLDAVKQLIAEYVNDALQAFVRVLPAVPPTLPPNNTATVEIPRSGLVNSGSGGTPNESRDGRPDLFIKAHSGAQKVEKRMEDIFKVKQGDTELLREFVDRFQRERMLLPRVPDNWAAMAFTSNLNEKSSEAMRGLKESLREFLAMTWNNVYNRYSTKLRIEEDIVAQSKVEEKTGLRRSESEKRSDKNRYKPYLGPSGREARSKFENVWADHRFANRDSGSSSSRFRKDRVERNRDANTNARIGDYNFNVSTSKLVAVLRSMGDKVRWPKEMRSSLNRKNPNFWCKFHNDHDYRTSDCSLLQGEVEHLLKQGYLTKLFSEKGKQAYMKNRQEPPKPPSPKRTVNVINGREEVNGVTYTAARKTTKFTITHVKRTRQTLEDDNITFDDADANGLMIPHNDALVISLLIHDTNVKQVLIDPGSFVNIILLRVVNEMLMGDRVVPKARSLSGFDNSTVITKGEIELRTYA